MTSDRTALRRAVLFGTPLLYVVLGILHPMVDPGLGDPTGLFIGLHVGQLALIAGLACALWLLVDGLDSRAARVARALILPYVILYTTLDALAGIGMGGLIRSANALPVAEQATVGRFLEEAREADVAGYAVYFGASLFWFAAVLAAAVALRNHAPRPALVLLALGALVFGIAHPKPTGPIGMALLLAGLIWLELRPRAEEALPPVTAERSAAPLGA